MIYRHALGAILLLVWRSSGALTDRLYGCPAQFLFEAMQGMRRPPYVLEMPILRLRFYIFDHVTRLLHERYAEND